jgi:hypothetical protein
MSKTWKKGFKGPFTKADAIRLGESVMRNVVPYSTIEVYKIRKLKNKNLYQIYFLAEW